MARNVHIVCGLDPGLRITGYGVLRVDNGEDTVQVVDAGVIRCSTHESLALRLAELAAGVDEVLDEHDVDTVAVEQIYSHYQRPRTAILMAHARGVLLLEAARRECRILHLPSTTVKRHLTGSGRASKEQMQAAVANALSLDALPEPPDVADALAVALCAVGVMQHPARIAPVNDDLLTQ
ncbi:MAG TPA: crossover junction endodeoxyribonuclease RuvC [Phycisphaerae bacterium]|nr:crossover junction endodeoxyribonuclease RuvC [Phycisphaerae bacterium]HRY68571.1 crossover junction endodeoxyribonuclease RuvC [Phycisphaerae bacterium]HSA25620.1 crossover junction endodeoxyribonuclease RuvC [Phycisphaerae bacterium]